MNDICQSCGMPLRKDPQGGGTNADGAKSAEYCSYCYQKGAFTRPDFTAKRMQDFCYDKLREMGMSRMLAWLFTRSIPRLRRWK